MRINKFTFHLRLVSSVERYQNLIGSYLSTYSTINLIGPCNKHPNIQRHKDTRRAKKVVSDSPGLEDFAFGLVNSVLNLCDGQVDFLGKFKLQKDGYQSC